MSQTTIGSHRIVIAVNRTANRRNQRRYRGVRTFLNCLISLALIGASSPLTAQEKATTILDAVEMRLATLPEGTAGMVAEYIPEGNGKIILMGGYRTDGVPEELKISRDIWVYDPTLDELTSMGSLPIGLALAAHVYVPEENKIFLFGGLEDDGSVTESNAVRVFDIETGELVTLSATLASPRSRSAAVYVPNLQQIFLFGGVTGGGAASVSPFESSTQDLIEVFDIAGGSLHTVGFAPGWYVDAHFVPSSYPAVPIPEDPGQTTILASSFIYLAGPDGYAVFDPVTRDFLKIEYSLEINGLLGAATAYVPRRQRVWSAGGYGARSFVTQCWQGTVVATDPTNLDDPTAGYRSLGNVPLEKIEAPVLQRTQIDGSAVHVPDLDRVILFGGFLAPEGDECVQPSAPNPLWPLLPGASTYSTGFYSVTPEYSTVPGSPNSPLVPTEINGDAIAGNTVTVTVRRAVPPLGISAVRPDVKNSILAEDESFVLALQAAYEDPGRSPELDMRFLARIDGLPSSDTIEVSVDLPDDISSGADQRDQQVVAICTLSVDRTALPPNCREIALTLNPGTIAGTITRNLTGIGQPGVIEPVAGAVVVLRDKTNDLVAEATTDAFGHYDLCPPPPPASPIPLCLAIGSYSLSVSKPFVNVPPENEFVHLPVAVTAEVAGGVTTPGDVTMQVSAALGPTIKRMSADHNALTGDEIGTFLSFEHLRGKPGVPEIPTVLNTFTVETETTVSQTSRVEFELNGAPPYPASGGGNTWIGLFNMSEVLHAGENILRVTAYDSSVPIPLSTTREFKIRAVPAKPVNGVLKSYVDLVSIEWSPAKQRYTSQIIVPNNLRWPDNPPAVLDLVLIKLYSQALADISLIEDYHLDGHWEARGDGAIALQLLSADPDEFQMDEPFPVTPSYSFDFSRIESYRITSERFDLCELGLPKCGEWVEFYKYPCDPDKNGITPQRKVQCLAQQASASRGFSASAAGFSASITLKLELTLSAQYSATLLIDGTLRGDTWQVDQLRVIPTPHLGLQAKGEGTARGHVRAPAYLPDFSFSITGGVIAEAHLYYEQPIVYEPDHSPPLYLDDPCFNFLARAQAWLDLPSPIPNLTTPWWVIAEEDLPSGCFAGRSTAKEHLPDPEPPSVMPNPVMAVSQFGDKAVFLWVEETETAPGLIESHLFFDAESPLGPTSGIVPTGGQVVDPAIAFVTNDDALAVWAELAPADGATSVPELLSTQEVYAATWNVATGWSTPVALSTNTMADGRPVVATDPLAGPDGLAIVAWVRDPDANPETAGDLQIVARDWDGSSWGAEQLVADEPGAADTDPAVAFRKNGTSEAWMFWVRDHDGSFATNDDRFLNHSTWNGASWSQATEPADWPSGALSPDLVFSPNSSLSERPLVTMVARETGASPDGSGPGSPGMGFESRLFAAWWGMNASEWEVIKIGDTRAEQPQVMLASDDRALIVLRSFGGGDPDSPPRLGSVAVAAGELGLNGSRWVAPGSITTDDDDVFWLISGASIPLQSAGDGDFPFHMAGVLENLDGRHDGLKAEPLNREDPAQVATAKGVTAKVLGGTNLTGVMNFAPRTDGVDLELEKLTVDNEQPEPGDLVTVYARIRNTTVRPMSEALGTGPPEACLYIDGQPVPDFENQICAPRYYGEILFNERITFELQYRSTGRPELVKVEVTNGGDLDPENQVAEIRVGSIPGPQALALAAVQPENGGGSVRVEAGWQAPPVPGVGNSWSYRIYRGPAETGPWELLAFTTRLSYTDAAPDVDELFYAVEAYDRLNRQSIKTVAQLLTLAEDSDGDGVPDASDRCPGSNDGFDADNDGVPDGCDRCADFDDEADGDGDGVPDGCDLCANFNDNIDTDGDGIPDACDLGDPPGGGPRHPSGRRTPTP